MLLFLGWGPWLPVAIVLVIALSVCAETGTVEQPAGVSQATPRPAPTSTPVPTPAPVPPPTPTSTPEPKTIGVSLADFEEKFGGMSFYYAATNSGRDRWMAVTEYVFIELRGSSQSLEQATMLVSTENSLATATIVSEFLDTAAPGWEAGLDWVNDHSEEATQGLVDTMVEGLKVELLLDLDTENLMLVVEGR